MAHKRRATDITAVDIDEWCIENSEENFSLNGCDHVKLSLGGIETVQENDPFDIILANINKNVLLDQIGAYSERLKNKGTLVLSGFYTEDIADLMAEAGKFGLVHQEQTERNRWAMLAIEKRIIL